MKAFSIALVLAACALHLSNAFSPSPLNEPAWSSSCRRINGGACSGPLLSATLESGSEGGATPVRAVQHIPTLTEKQELKTIRKELIKKYIKLGHSEDYAAGEVDYFLEDPERSAQYIEMRQIAMASGNDLGIENIVQFAMAFMVGMIGSGMMNSYHTYQVANPDGGLPWL